MDSSERIFTRASYSFCATAQPFLSSARKTWSSPRASWASARSFLKFTMETASSPFFSVFTSMAEVAAAISFFFAATSDSNPAIGLYGMPGPYAQIPMPWHDHVQTQLEFFADLDGAPAWAEKEAVVHALRGPNTWLAKYQR